MVGLDLTVRQVGQAYPWLGEEVVDVAACAAALVGDFPYDGGFETLVACPVGEVLPSGVGYRCV